MYSAKVVAKSGNTVNFRATMNGRILAAVPVGTIVEILSEPNQWWREVKYNGKLGYMMTEFLQKVETAATTTSTVDKTALK
jgi:uncharacterized protein YgiM (DUF1202 family)